MKALLRPVAAAFVLWLALVPARAMPPSGTFKVTFDAAVLDAPYTGRVYIALGSADDPSPRGSMWDWFQAPQVLSLDVSNVKPGQSVTIGPGAHTFRAHAFAALRAGTYSAQAVARINPDSPKPGEGAGDLYGPAVSIEFAPDAPGVAELVLSSAVEKPAPARRERVEYVEIASKSLSEFYGREVKSRAGVYLPSDWKADSTVGYPTIYFITGFGDDHTFIRALSRMWGSRDQTRGMILVVPDPLCLTGHSVFADSANNGPRGTALVQELIPAVEEKFQGAKDAQRRFVTGISSGGWSSLWLQVEYPEEFAGCWSHCPDPVDFRDFQRIDLYAQDANVYTDEKGARRALARGPAGNPMIYYDDFVRQETVMGLGGQIGSFEAVFSPRAAPATGPGATLNEGHLGGAPKPLFDRATGAVDPIVAKAWEKYDIRLKLEREWPTRGPKLKGKLHIYAGELDTFYLEGATRLLKESLEKLGSDADIRIIPKMMHTIYRPGVESMFKAIREKCGLPEPTPKPAEPASTKRNE